MTCAVLLTRSRLDRKKSNCTEAAHEAAYSLPRYPTTANAVSNHATKHHPPQTSCRPVRRFPLHPLELEQP